MDSQLKVTPAELQKTASSFSSRGKIIASQTEAMMSLVNNLVNVWQGDASTAYIRTFSGLQDDIARINTKIQEHASDLNLIAENFINVENRNAEDVSVLPSNPLD